ncbi:unnamed protein product [Miscanthus lutarioriparius]|uniref:Uncharacterized protein n=1 Tax=Miscanthus lutarioriparius TaxID=422564 RepID=A0A811MUY2_9POAL|nr:unnamed protein product [Miscanthus lutarioriparius]
MDADAQIVVVRAALVPLPAKPAALAGIGGAVQSRGGATAQGEKKFLFSPSRTSKHVTFKFYYRREEQVTPHHLPNSDLVELNKNQIFLISPETLSTRLSFAGIIGSELELESDQIATRIREVSGTSLVREVPSSICDKLNFIGIDDYGQEVISSPGLENVDNDESIESGGDVYPDSV